ncbi:MAG: hypothetical protein ACTSPV_18075, partial [Candidatus Hodarchaeales archaeon]
MKTIIEETIAGETGLLEPDKSIIEDLNNLISKRVSFQDQQERDYPKIQIENGRVVSLRLKNLYLEK